MELQIQDLVSSIKKEGIDAANLEAEKILAEAREKANSLLASAKADAQAEKESAEKEISLMKASAQVSAEQAKRDAMLSFKEEVQSVFEKILSSQIRGALSDELLSKLILAALQGESLNDYSVEVAEVSDGLKGLLADEIRNGLEIRPSRNVSAGFRLSAKDGSGYFDCSDDEIMKMLAPYFRTLNF